MSVKATPNEWVYRVKSRKHIPDFYTDVADNVEVLNFKKRRFMTPMPRNRDADPGLPITFLEDIIRDKNSATHMS